MVYYQVEGLFKMFADLDELERNNWILSQPSPKKTKLQVIPWCFCLFVFFPSFV